MIQIIKKLWLGRNKKVMLGGLVATLLLAGISFWLLQNDWERSSGILSQDFESSQTAAKTILDSSEVSLKTLQSAQTSLENVSARSCELPLIHSWRRYVSDEADHWQESCEYLVAHSREASDDIENLIALLEGQAVLAQIIADTMVAIDSLGPNEYDQAIEAWKKAVSALDEANPEGELKDQAERLVSGAQSIVEAYGVLKEADASNKRTSYDDASINLQNAYKELGDVGKQAEDSYKAVAEKVVAKLQKI